LERGVNLTTAKVASPIEGEVDDQGINLVPGLYMPPTALGIIPTGRTPLVFPRFLRRAFSHPTGGRAEGHLTILDRVSEP